MFLKGDTGVTIQNDPTYLFIQWLGWDYNFWTMILADIILIVAFFIIVFVGWFIIMILTGELR